jgi:hypothetical protein
VVGERDSNLLVSAQRRSVVGEEGVLLDGDTRKQQRLLHVLEEDSHLDIADVLGRRQLTVGWRG